MSPRLKATLRGLRRWTRWPPVRTVRFADLGRVEPIRRAHTRGWGTAVDDYYASRFLSANLAELRGIVLHVDGAPEAAPAALGDEHDASAAARVDRKGYDGVVCRQVLEYADDPAATIARLQRLLRPGGVLLVSLDGMGARPARRDALWSFTTASATRLFGEHFARVRVSSFGNVRSAVACLQGIAAEELGEERLGPCDPDYPVVVGVRAERDAGAKP